MRFGTKCQRGFLPIYSVDTQEEAVALLTLTCPTNLAGEFVARELVHEQTLENLEAFGERLEKAHLALRERANKKQKRRNNRPVRAHRLP